MKKILSICFCMVAFGVAASGQTTNEAAQIFGNPDFQKRLFGSYGIRSEVEPPSLEREEVEFYNEQVVTAVNAGNQQGAIQALKGYITPTTNANFDFTLATLYLQNGQLDNALNSYRSAVKKFPEFMRAHKNLGIVEAQMGDFPKALASLSKSIELGGFDGDTFGLIGYCYFSLGNYVSSLDAYRMASVLNPENKAWRVGKSRVLVETGMYSQAIVSLKELLEEDPSDSRYWQTMANAYISLEDYQSAIASLEVNRRMGKATLSSLRTLGDLYTNEFLANPALACYTEAIASGMTIRDCLRVIDVFMQRGYLIEAQEMIDRTRSARTESMSSEEKLNLLNFEAMLAMRGGDEAGAVKALESILHEDPTNGRALLLLAKHYQDQGELGEADFYFERAEKSSDSKIAREALISHAVMKVSQSLYADAADLLRRALSFREEQRLRDYLEAVESAARR